MQITVARAHSIDYREYRHLAHLHNLPVAWLIQCHHLAYLFAPNQSSLGTGYQVVFERLLIVYLQDVEDNRCSIGSDHLLKTCLMSFDK